MVTFSENVRQMLSEYNDNRECINTHFVYISSQIEMLKYINFFESYRYTAKCSLHLFSECLTSVY